MKDKGEFLIFRLYILGSAIIIGTAIVIGSRMIADAVFMGQMISSRQIAFSIGQAMARPLARPAGEIILPGAKTIEGVKPGLGPVKGDLKAKVLIVEFSDMTCPFCHKFHNEIFPMIDKEFIQTGKAKFSYRNFFSHPGPVSRDAALALICSQSQNKYWQMLDTLYSAQSLDKAQIDKAAQGLRMDMKKFQSCLGNKAALDLLADDLSSAAKLGVQSTPTIFINGRLVEGTYPYAEFKRIIEEELAK